MASTTFESHCLVFGLGQIQRERNEKFITFRVSLPFKMATEAAVAALEVRAANAEKNIVELQSAAASASNADVAVRLKELFALMSEDRKEAEEVRAHRDELKAENEKLRAQVGKLNYRVKHLLKTIEEIEAKKE